MSIKIKKSVGRLKPKLWQLDTGTGTEYGRLPSRFWSFRLPLNTVWSVFGLRLQNATPS